MSKYNLDYLDELEAEAIHILREVAGQFEKPALLFSGGKDSITLVRLAEKAFRPGKFPFPLVHIDTGHNFEETITYRDQMVERIGEKLIIGHVQESIDQGKVVEQTGKNASRNALQTVTLLDTIALHGFDACIGGARRDEEKARAKERIFSVRDEFGQWDPKRQRPELWNIYNGKIKKISLLGAFGGFIDAVGGGGWGSIVLSSLIAGGRSPRFSLGTVKITRFFIALMSSLTFITMLNGKHWEAVAGLVIGSALASPIAAKVSNKISAKAIMLSVGVIVILVSLRSIIIFILKLI